ncbi:MULTISPECIES: hypothetical protein [unclassified Methylosinus]|uniref:hypothetical protein n=1 Tax=unclassified Methylosinus TaxID=2624500 RepID=UPI001FEF08CD|nr:MULTISPECIES: hypothetical protein [unclassified Methylosinus]
MSRDAVAAASIMTGLAVIVGVAVEDASRRSATSVAKPSTEFGVALEISLRRATAALRRAGSAALATSVTRSVAGKIDMDLQSFDVGSHI